MRPPDSRPSFETALRASFRMRALQLREVDRLVAIERARHWRQRVFKPCCAVKQHHPITLCNTTFGEALLVGGVSGSTFGAEQQPLLARDFVERSGNLLVRHRNGESLALAHRA